MSFRNLSLFLIFAITLTSSTFLYPQATLVSHSPQERHFVRESVLQARDFPLLDQALRNPQEYAVLADDPELKQLTIERWKQVATANHDCADNLACKSKAVEFAPEQIQQVSSALRRLYGASALFRAAIDQEFVPRTTFTLNANQDAVNILVEEWKRSADGLNLVISTYAEGTPPRYKQIDSISYDPNSQSYSSLIRIILDGLSIGDAGPVKPIHSLEALFFEPTLRFALRLLQANSRDEAGRFWPLESGENYAAIHRVGTIHWSHYLYSTIVVPGEGLDIAGVPLSPRGKERLRLAVNAYREGLAPFILLTGGFVHPSQTPFCEAMEMKRYLREVYGLPESVILVDPYARHTTTNLRNAAREIYAYSLPDDRPMLIVSDTAQTDYIQGETFQKRMRDELGYLPAILGKRLSSARLEATPSKQSLFVDPLDPLDP